MEFIPILTNLGQLLHKYVIKIIVKQGDPKQLYCDKQNRAYMRYDGMVKQLDPETYKKEVISLYFI